MTSGGIGGEVIALDVMFRGSFERDDGREETVLASVSAASSLSFCNRSALF
jgi:hypothetical protein